MLVFESAVCMHEHRRLHSGYGEQKDSFKNQMRTKSLSVHHALANASDLIRARAPENSLRLHANTRAFRALA
jgi:hypothetical protein